MDSPAHRQLPPMPGFQPGTGYRPGGPIPSNAAFQAQMDQLAMLSKIPQAPGLYGATGFFPDPPAATSEKVILRMLDALLPGTFDLPGEAEGEVMSIAGGSGRCEAAGGTRKVLNYSTSIYAPIGGGVIAGEVGGFLVAVASFS